MSFFFITSSIQTAEMWPSHGFRCSYDQSYNVPDVPFNKDSAIKVKNR